MTKKEREIQKALGLMHKWDIYVKFKGDSFYTIYIVNAPTKNAALTEGCAIIFKQGRKIHKRRNYNFQPDIFVNGPDPAEIMFGAKHAKHAK